MPLTSLRASLRDEGLLPVYVVVGDAAPIVEQAVAAIVEAALPTVGPPAFNHNTLRAPEVEASAAFNAARTLPMMAERRLVVVRDIHDADDAFFGNLVDYIKAAVGSATLVCVGERFPKVVKGGSNWSVRVRKALDGVGHLTAIDAKKTSPVRFARDHARALGKELGQAEAEVLVELVGVELGRVAQEVEKVALYVGSAPAIDRDAVHASCSLLAEAVIWDLTAAMAGGDADAALGALHRLQEGGDDPRRLLSMIVWQYRELLKVAELIRSGASDADIQRSVRMRRDVYYKVKARVGRGFPGAADVLHRLADAHRQMNSHRAGDQRILEGLVLQMLA